MKIVLVTTLPSLIENKRIEEEVIALGHTFELKDLSAFNFVIKDGVLNTFDVHNADLVIVRGIFSSIKSIATIIEDLREKGVGVFDNNLLAHQYSIDKVADIIKLASDNISVPDTYYTRDFDDFQNAVDKIGLPMVVKSTRMGKGAGIVRLESEQQLYSFVNELKAEQREAKGYIIQKFIDYEHDLRVLILGDRAFTMKRIPKAGDFRANFSLGGSVEGFELSEDDKKLAHRALNAVDLQIGGVDILIGKDGKRFVLEVNHTAGMVGMEKALSQNIVKIYIEYAIANAK